jgi:hypothetical protein
MHVKNMSQAPLNAIPRVLVVGPYLCTLVWHATKGDVTLFRLVPQGAAMIPHPSGPHAPFSLGMDIESRSPSNFFIGFPKASITFHILVVLR